MIELLYHDYSTAARHDIAGSRVLPCQQNKLKAFQSTGGYVSNDYVYCVQRSDSTVSE